jgi:hypothetical protein
MAGVVTPWLTATHCDICHSSRRLHARCVSLVASRHFVSVIGAPTGSSSTRPEFGL